MRTPTDFFIEQARRMQEQASNNRSAADSKPTISVRDLVTWQGHLITCDGKMYEVTAKELELSK